MLIKWYQREPLPLNQNNLLGKTLIASMADLPTGTFTVHEIHSEKVKVEMSVRLAKYYEKFDDAFELGFYFEKVVQHMINTHIVAQVRCGVSARKALSDFYELYNIDEDEYALEIAYLNYQRNKRKFN